MMHPTLADAAVLVVRSDVAAVAVVIALVVAWAVAGVFHVRAAVPQASMATCLRTGPAVLFGPPVLWGDRYAAGLAATAAAVSVKAVGPLSAVAFMFLLARNHLPVGLTSPVAVAGAVGLAAILTVSVSAAARRSGVSGYWRASRGPQLGVSALLGGVTVSSATMLCALALTHTGGQTISPLEAFAAASAAQVVTLLRLPPAGIGVADGVLAGLLVGAGASPGAALATAALWRLGMLAAWAAAVLVRRRAGAGEELAAPAAPTGSALGELVHRTAFRLLASAPPPLARRARRMVFQSLFSASEDPWRYAALPYEARKRRHLLDAVGPGPGTVVELGCADGHNLAALAAALPDTRLVGVDISARAVEVARVNVQGSPHVTVLEADFRGAPTALRAHGIPTVDTLVLSEVLYYLGGRVRVREELGGLRDLLVDGTRVVLLHPSADASRLHPVSLEALGAVVQEVVVVDDPERPVTLHIGRVRTAYRPADPA